MKKIIFTDLDGTLTRKDTYRKFLRENFTFTLVLKNVSTLLFMLIEYLLGSIDGNEVKRVTFRIFFRGYKVPKEMQSFVESILWNEPLLNLVKSKQQEGYMVVIVSASPDIYLPYICDYLGFDAYIATSCVQKNGYLSGEFDGEVCNFEEKPKRIIEFLGAEQPEQTLSYGNSSGDYAMLEWCDEAYFVKDSNIKRYKK